MHDGGAAGAGATLLVAITTLTVAATPYVAR